MKQREWSATPAIHADPNGGVIIHQTCWRPQVGDPNPEQPGERVTTFIYHPTRVQDPCPCGGGQRFAFCCRLLPYWRPVCLNPDRQEYSLVQPQSARFTDVSAAALSMFLQHDQRLYCVEETPQRLFWTYWGYPASDCPQGKQCFGDIELLENRTLLLTALSDIRMEMLQELVHPFTSGIPHRQHEPLPRLEKPKPTAPTRKRQQHKT